LPETKRFCNFMLQLLKPTPQFEICRWIDRNMR
jgi:hypothetical protein